MSNYQEIEILTEGEKFYNITEQIQESLEAGKSGILVLYMPHTSCALTISEAFDPSAATDMQNFLRHLAPNNLAFIQHSSEGPDDSPSHMKSILLQQTLCLIVENGKLVLGKWQGIYLAEFRTGHKRRKLLLKFLQQ